MLCASRQRRQRGQPAAFSFLSPFAFLSVHIKLSLPARVSSPDGPRRVSVALRRASLPAELSLVPRLSLHVLCGHAESRIQPQSPAAGCRRGRIHDTPCAPTIFETKTVSRRDSAPPEAQRQPAGRRNNGSEPCVVERACTTRRRRRKLRRGRFASKIKPTSKVSASATTHHTQD